MSSPSIPNSIILFHYPFSPYAHRIYWYLTLRRIPFAQCLQPPYLPRPDLSLLGIEYRRIPLLSIGRDVYADTRLILSELERRFPPSETHPPLTHSDPDTKALAALLSSFTIDGGVFARGAQLIPPTAPILSDAKFTADRQAFMGGRSWAKADIERARPEALAHMRRIFDVYETLLADGRAWVAGTTEPSLADIEGVWVLDWLVDLKALPVQVFGPAQFPAANEWVGRFREKVKAARKAGQVGSVKGAEAARHISAAEVRGDEGVDELDPLGLSVGDDVLVFPIDTGASHKDRGKLVRLTKEEVVIALPAKEGGKGVHLHAPRTGFRITKASGSAKL